MSKNASALAISTLTVFRLAALCTFLAVAMGAVVCATSSGASCPTWPGCRPDQLGPQWQLGPVVEFAHRVVAMAAGPLVLVAAVLSVRLHGADRWVRILPWVALLVALASGAFGRVVVLGSLPTWLGAVDLFCALMAMTAMGMAAVMAGARVAASASRPGPRRELVATGRLSAAGVVVLVAMHVSGVFVAGTGSYTRCIGWPLWWLAGGDLHPWLQGLRLGLAGVGAALVVVTVVVAWQRLHRWGVALGAVFAGEMLLGLVISARGLNEGAAAAYSVLAVALLWCLGLLTAVARATRPAMVAPSAQPGMALGELAEPGSR